MYTPDNYDAYLRRQRQQDDARKKLQVMARLEGSPLSDAQLAEDVAAIKGTKPAPVDVVKDNRAAFSEVVDDAWLENKRTTSPITFDLMSDPSRGPFLRQDYDFFGSLEQAVGKLARTVPAVQDGTGWAGGWQNSPPIPNVGGDVADEFATVRGEGDADPEDGRSIWGTDETPDAVDGGTAGAGGRIASSSIPFTGSRPDGELATDAATIRQQDGQPAGASAGNSGPRPGEGAVGLDGAVPSIGSTTGDTASPSAPFAGSRPNEELVPGSAAVGPQSDVQHDGLPTQAIDHVENNRPRPGEGAVGLDGAVPSSGSTAGNTANASHLTEASADDLAWGLAAASLKPVGPGTRDVSRFKDFSEYSSAPLMLNGPTFKIPTIKLPDGPSPRASLTLGIAGLGKDHDYWDIAALKKLISEQPDIPKDLALSTLEGVANGTLTPEQALAKLIYTPSYARENLADEIANAFRLTEEQARALAERIKIQSDLPVDLGLRVLARVRGDNSLSGPDLGPVDAKKLLMATTDEELSSITDSIVNARGKSQEEIGAIRKKIYEQNAIDPLLADKILKDIIDGNKNEEAARKVLSRIGARDHISELFMGMIEGAYSSIGVIGEGLGNAVKNGESDLDRSLVDDVMSTRGKGPEEIYAVTERINKVLDGNYPRQVRLIEGLDMLRDGRDPDEVLDYISIGRVGENMISTGQERKKDAKYYFGATEGRTHILGREVGEMLGPLLVGGVASAAVPGALLIYPGVTATSKTYVDALNAGASKEDAAKAAGETALLNAVFALPLGKAAKFIPGVGKYADTFVGSRAIQFGSDVAGQMGQNAIAMSYDEKRSLFKDVDAAAATSVLLSALQLGWKGLARGAQSWRNSRSAADVVVQSQGMISAPSTGAEIHGAISALSVGADVPVAGSFRNARADAQEAIRKSDVLKQLDALQERKAPYNRDRNTIFDLVQRSVEGSDIETIYFPAEVFVSAMKETGVDLAAFGERLGGVSPSDFQEAVRLKGYIPVPLALFVADMMGTKTSKILIEEGAFGPGAMSPAWARDLLSDWQSAQPNGPAPNQPGVWPALNGAPPKDRVTLP